MGTNRSGTTPRDGDVSPDPAVEGEILQAAEAQTREIISQSMFSGPLPDPATLAKYNDVQTGLVERIVSMSERASEAANNALASDAAVNYAMAESIKASSRAVTRGQWLFAGLTFMFLITAMIGTFITDSSLVAIPYIASILSAAGILIPPMGTRRWEEPHRNTDTA